MITKGNQESMPISNRDFFGGFEKAYVKVFWKGFE